MFIHKGVYLYFWGMNLKYCKNIAPDVYEILLIGEIGEHIKGRDVAFEIMYLNSIGAKIIKERINTIGGTIMDAFSIVAANISSEAEIHTINEGVCDSAGSFILASGKKGNRVAYDYATMLIHNPSIDGVMLEDLPEGKDKDEMIMFRDSIVTILSNNSGKTTSDIINMMKESRRLNAKDALNFGFIDSIKTSISTPAIAENMSVMEIMNVCKDFHNKHTDNLKIENKMKTVLNVLNLSEDASEASAVSAVRAITNKAEIAENKVVSLAKDIENLNEAITGKDASIAEKEAKIVELEGIVNESKVAAIKNVVDSAIESGKFDEENREVLLKQATTLGVENFSEMISLVKLPLANALSKVQNISDGSGKSNKDEDLAKEYEELAKNDPMALKELKNSNPAKFEKMLTAWNEA